MQPSELRLSAKNLNHVYRAQWDMTRILGCLVIQPHTKKKIAVKDVFSLPWDKEGELSHNEQQAMRNFEAATNLAGFLNNNNSLQNES